VQLGDSRYLLLVSFRRDGGAVATPLWFAEEDGMLFMRTERGSGKAKRIRRESRVLIAPSSWRGRPLAAPAQAHARILDAEAAAVAERALAGRYGLIRRVYARLLPTRDPAYIGLSLDGAH
jgi:uncharacterized protein